MNAPLPADWDLVKLEDICSITMGQSPVSNSYNFNRVGLPLIQGNADISNGVTDPQRYTSAPTKIVPNGSIIMTVRAPVGEVSRASQEVCLGRGVCGINYINNDFLYFMLKFHEKDWQKLEQGSTFTAIGGQQVKDFKIPLPPLAEQQAIVEVLESFDEHINNLDALIAKKRDIRTGALEDLMSGRVRVVGFSGEWKKVKLKNVARIIRGASPRPIERYLTSSNTSENWIKIGDAPKNGKFIGSTTEKITIEGSRFSVKVKKGDFILSNSMSFGRPYILKIEGCIHDGWLAISDFDKNLIDDYLFYVLSIGSTKEQFVSLAAGSGVKNLKKEIVNEVQIPLPPLPEQRAIAEVLSSLDEEIEVLEAERDKWQQVRAGAMGDLLSGKVRLGD